MTTKSSLVPVQCACGRFHGMKMMRKEEKKKDEQDKKRNQGRKGMRRTKGGQILLIIRINQIQFSLVFSRNEELFVTEKKEKKERDNMLGIGFHLF